MEIVKFKAKSRVAKNKYDTSKGIKQYGDGNSYPQDLLNILKASRTAKACLNVYNKFVKGAGFLLPELATKKVNSKQTFQQLHNKIVEDFNTFKGFAIHVNYNALLEPVSRHLIPFEQCRLEVDSDKNLTGRIAVHPDWTSQNGKTFKKQDITFFRQFTNDKNLILDYIAECEGFSNFKGLVFYYNEEVNGYPESHLDAIRELMGTQSASDNIRFRNVKYNYLPSGVMLIKSKGETANDSEDDDTNEAIESFYDWQGDENAGKILVMNIGIEEEKPEFVPFPINNLDKFTKITDEVTEKGIISYFAMPPILLGQDVGSSWGADLIVNAYDFYNSTTETERNTLKMAYDEVFSSLNPSNNQDYFKILPLKYNASASNATV